MPLHQQHHGQAALPSVAVPQRGQWNGVKANLQAEPAQLAGRVTGIPDLCLKKCGANKSAKFSSGSVLDHLMTIWLGQ